MKKGKIKKNKNIFKPAPGKFNVKITFSDVYQNDIKSIVLNTQHLNHLMSSYTNII